MHSTAVTSQSEVAAVSLTDAKSQLGIYHNDLDGNIRTALESAIAYCETRTGRALRESETIVQGYPQWPVRRVCFVRQPVRSITSVTYWPESGSQQTISASEYRLIASTNAGSHLEFDDNFNQPGLDTRDDAVQVTYVAGYATEGSGEPQVPPQAKQAVLLRLQHDWGELMPREQEAARKSVDSLLASIEWGCYR